MLPFTDTLLPPTTDDPAGVDQQAAEAKPPTYLLTGKSQLRFLSRFSLA